MTTWKQLSRPLHLAIAAPWCLLAALAAVAATPATRTLLLDAANKPTADVSLASTHWTGTLDPARLPASVAQYAGDQSLTTPGAVALGGSLHDQYGAPLIDDPGQFHASQIYSRAGDPSIDLSDPNTGYLRCGGGVEMSWTYDGINVSDALSVGVSGIYLAADGTAVFNGEVQLTEGIFIGNGSTVIDGSGNLSAFSLNVDVTNTDYFQSYQGFGVFGVSGPTIQPDPIADATDLDSVIAGFNALKADMVSYGLLAP